MFHVSTLLPYTPNNKQQVRMESPAFYVHHYLGIRKFRTFVWKVSRKSIVWNAMCRLNEDVASRLKSHTRLIKIALLFFFNLQLLRKRHIGNDIVTIVFQEPGAHPFTPKAVRSHFQHVFIIVRVHNPCSDNTCYRWVFVFLQQSDHSESVCLVWDWPLMETLVFSYTSFIRDIWFVFAGYRKKDRKICDIPVDIKVSWYNNNLLTSLHDVSCNILKNRNSWEKSAVSGYETTTNF